MAVRIDQKHAGSETGEHVGQYGGLGFMNINHLANQ